jgi:molybdate transport system substrate-binding protein
MHIRPASVAGRVLLVALALACTLDRPHAAEIKVIVANALKEAYVDLVADFEKSSGHTVATTWSGTVNATKKVHAGEIYDLVIVGSDNVDQLVVTGKVVSGSRADFARTGIAAAVRSGLPKPDVSSETAVKESVLAAASIAYSAGPSGTYIAQLFKKMRILEQVAPRVKQSSSGAEVAAMIARGEVDFGFAQVSEFLNAPGLVNLGPLPASIQHYTTYAIGLHTSAPAPDAARLLIRHLMSPAAEPAIKKIGMEPGSKP